ncbi:alpha-mannosidase [Virgibacillus salexigens]|uniref:alpha-mannosidase n=1 Tax=Virgibacillus salexigens TaxID=61016 RepID=UPI00190CC6F9|nr:alpha-mannosidase [Virgibacillus salexigens]
MEDNQTVHIISHTHWDREWYLPYERHHILLVELMDRLLEALENNQGYKSFHLDGQTIMLDDYVQVRPEMKEKLKTYIKEGRIHVGPWYILQDAFLTSSESNVRNLLYGIKDSNDWGGVTKIGYFPDTFGNIGQAPQLLRQAGIHHAVFGRGVKPTGFNNMIQEASSYESPYSEMCWRSPDGSTVIGILFANWYCNGNEIPLDDESAKIYWQSQLKSLEKYASSSQMLVMNGCDHQPVQYNLPEAIQVAKKLYPNIDFKHSNFNDYCKELSSAIPNDVKIIDGELRSQHTDGWGTLVNTASSRIYLKQLNQQNQVLLEKVAEPLASFAWLQGDAYDHDLFEYGWKTLMQNHPHDSICGCSIDDVHREMVTRFEKTRQVAKGMINKSLTFLSGEIDTSMFNKWGKSTIPFVVFNTTGHNRTGVITINLDVVKQYLSEGINKQKLKNFSIQDREVLDNHGNILDCQIEDLGIEFDFDLPKDEFRRPYMARRLRLTFEAENIPALGYNSFALVLAEGSANDCVWDSLICNDREMENHYLHVKINPNGSLTVTNKINGQQYNDLCIYEDTGDIGNEYMYKQPSGEKTITTRNIQAKIFVVKDTSFQAEYEIVHEWELPISASTYLHQEQKELVWFTERKSQRVSETITHKITTRVRLEKNSKGVYITTSFNNQAKDHRMRVLFPTDILSDVHYTDSVFEVVKRFNKPAKEWKNPDHSQHQQAFVNISNEKSGLTVSNLGLNEYEILRDGRNTIAITLLRAVGELGDWGYFPTPDAQCLGEHIVSYSIFPHEGEQSRLASYQASYQSQVPWTVNQLGLQTGELPPTYAFIEWESTKVSFTALKVSHTSNDIIFRGFNMAETEAWLSTRMPIGSVQVYRSNILEEELETLSIPTSSSKLVIPVNQNEIVTVGFKKAETIG